MPEPEKCDKIRQLVNLANQRNMLYKKIKDDLKDSMLKKETVKTTTLRGLVAAIVNDAVALKKEAEELSDDEVMSAVKRAAKQRKDSIEQFKKGGREDLAKSEQEELEILETYLPKMMSKKEIKAVVEKKKKELGITDKSKVGALMSAIMKELKNKADGADVKEVVNALFE